MQIGRGGLRRLTTRRATGVKPSELLVISICLINPNRPALLERLVGDLLGVLQLDIFYMLKKVDALPELIFASERRC